MSLQKYLPDDMKVHECRTLGSDGKKALLSFFEALIRSGDDQFFHPHPFTSEEVDRILGYSGPDVYCVLLKENDVLGYGMLRGREEGYVVPSLGIAIHPAVRGTGLGRAFMLYLQAVARQRGNAEIRVKVYEHNEPARRLYEALGYVFRRKEGNQLIGSLLL